MQPFHPLESKEMKIKLREQLEVHSTWGSLSQARSGWSPVCARKPTTCSDVALEAQRRPPCEARIPLTNPSPGTILAGPLVGLRFVEQLRCRAVRQRGLSHRFPSPALHFAPLSSLVQFPSSLQVVFRQKVRLELFSLV